MARLITAAQRITRARGLLKQACEVPRPANTLFLDLEYVARIKDTLRQAKELIRFIPLSPSASAETKKEVADLNAEIDQAEKELLRPNS